MRYTQLTLACCGSFVTGELYESGAKNLLTLLNLEKIEEGLFRGQSEDLGLRRVFGGRVVGQALYAAKETVPDERLVHSFHSYFFAPR